MALRSVLSTPVKLPPHALLALCALACSCTAAPGAVATDAAVAADSPVSPDATTDTPAPLAEALAARAADFVGTGSVTIAPTGVPDRVAQLPTLVVGVVSPGFTGIRTYARPGEAMPTARSVYPISSLSKLVTGLIAARSVVAGDFAADTLARTLLRDDLAPHLGDRTVAELATHTAGYNANPRDLDLMGQPHSPAAGYSRAQLAVCLASAECSTARATRGQYLYSNLSVALLGIALTDRYDQPFEALVAERLARPLGMVDTHLRPLADDARIVRGWTLAGVPVPPATMGVLAPAGELLSTGEDMLRLLDAMVRPRGEMAPVVALATRAVRPGVAMGYAIDLLSRRGLDVWAKSGEQAGYSSMIMGCPALGAGVFALTNVGMSSRTLAGLTIDLLVVLRDAGTSSSP